MKTPVIICVDDERTLLNSLQTELKSALWGEYLIETAESGEDALELVEELLEEGADLPLVISDQLMPGMKGDELLRKIHLIAPKTMKILLTGQANLDAVGNIINHANLYRYITKPWEPTNLLMTVKKAIQSYFQEQAQVKFYADLEIKVAERTQQLQDKNEFLSMAVHDLKNPLSAIQGFSEMIKCHFDEIPKEMVIDFAEQIFTSSRHLFDVIKNILDINAIEAGKMNPSLDVLDIRQTLQWLIKHYNERAKAKNITLQFQYPEEAYFVRVDETLLRQVLDNLLSNAIKYSPSGKPIYIRFNQDDQFRGCEIQDEGPGLNDEDQKRLFNQFTRLTPQPTGNEHSSGLGLFMVKKWVEAMHGEVQCESILGQGSTFRVKFPAA
ncbi:MAG: hypothetical protein DRQ49_00675 [Gammaproteobacteria bacterium]|nr:MAG: hypothetical protein DRQ49_00675 [Gammaproteobacteria bacterium]RKZ76335.1 MAG: hypothetical protein DRQ57_04280 [Gammaproteobacteria bacterium]